MGYSNNAYEHQVIYSATKIMILATKYEVMFDISKDSGKNDMIQAQVEHGKKNNTTMWIKRFRWEYFYVWMMVIFYQIFSEKNCDEHQEISQPRGYEHLFMTMGDATVKSRFCHFSIN